MKKRDNKYAGARFSEDEIRKLQELEGNPFTPEDEAMFAMFDREGWTPEQRIAYLDKVFSKIAEASSRGDQ
ncbi:hypothetical protein [Hyphomonas sp.]|uniref:hypothetical protein n=1 Tax=Hyphomonas sp. TaxID=87 RepID=UPI00260FE16C|nr:hypothetical protein [Hyphomonas sp.]MDF1807763.1 hypothetical protein [Hyphomonas sp.]